MVAGHLQQKKGYWYMVLSLRDEAGKRKSKWIATYLPAKGDKLCAEEMLFRTRHAYCDPAPGEGLLFSDYILQWLSAMKSKGLPSA